MPQEMHQDLQFSRDIMLNSIPSEIVLGWQEMSQFLPILPLNGEKYLVIKT